MASTTTTVGRACDNSGKRLKSAEPDVTVVVGKGDDAKEFHCHKIALAVASGFFDAMFSSNFVENTENRVAFPMKEPEEWQLFYTFIEHQGRVTGSNARTLVPWFHEFGMPRYLVDCDMILRDEVKQLSASVPTEMRSPPSYNSSFWRRSDRTSCHERRERFDKLIELLQFACTYGLPKTIHEAGLAINFLCGMTYHTVDLFTLAHVKVLTRLCLPLIAISEEDDSNYLMATGESPVFWEYLSSTGFDDNASEAGASLVEDFSVDELNDSKMLPLLVIRHLQHIADTKKSQDDKAITKEVVEELLDTAPHSLRMKMTGTLSRDSESVAMKSERCLKKIIRTHYKENRRVFRRLGVHVPSSAEVSDESSFHVHRPQYPQRYSLSTDDDQSGSDDDN